MFRPTRMIAGTVGATIAFGFLTLTGSSSIGAPAPPAPPMSNGPSAPAQSGKTAPGPAAQAPGTATPKDAPFPDVPAKHPAAASVLSLKDKKIMGAKADGKFHGPDYVTRFELAVILDNFVNYNENEHKPVKITSATGPITLSAPVGHWAYSAQMHLARNEFLPGNSPLFKAPGTAKVTTTELTDALAQVEIALSDRSLPITNVDGSNAPTKPVLPSN